MSTNLQFLLIVLGASVGAFILSVIWGRVTRPDSFDRDTAVFLGKMYGGIACGLIALYFLLKYKVL